MRWNDVKAALIRIRRNLVSSLAVIACVAVGLAAASSISTLIYAALLRPLPFADAEQLVRVWVAPGGNADQREPLSLNQFRALQSSAQTLDQAAAVERVRLGLLVGDRVARARGEAVSDHYFPLLGVQPALGRLFAADEYSAGAVPTMLLSYRLWSGQFNADPQIVGKTIRSADAAFTVVGVMPPEFRGSVDEDRIEFWTPLLPHLGAEGSSQSDEARLLVLGRTSSGLSPSAVGAEMAALGGRLSQAMPAINGPYQMVVEPLGASWRQEFRAGGVSLAISVALLLAVACSNVAGVMLLRVWGNQRQLAVQSALGASRWRVFSSLLIESTILVSLGGAVGIVAAPWLLQWLLSHAPMQLPDYLDLQPSLVSTVLALIILGLTALAAGLLPAWLGTRIPVSSVLKQGGRASIGAGQARLGKALVIAEIALTMVLLASSTMLIRSHLARHQIDLGYHTEVARLAVTLSEQDALDDASVRAFQLRLEAELRKQPGIQDVGLVWPALPPRGWSQWPIRWAGMPPQAQEAGMQVGAHAASASFFSALDIDLLAGRSFAMTDTPASAPVCVVSHSLAGQLGGVEQALGKSVSYADQYCRVVGVVADVRYGGAERSPADRLDLYLALGQAAHRLISIAARTGQPPEQMLASLTARVQALAPTSPVHWVSSMDQELGMIYAEPRFYVLLIGTFASVACLLTAIGVYALLSNLVLSRRREFGVRLAIGASPGRVRSQILTLAMALTIAGCMTGLLGVWITRGVLQDLLFQPAGFDWLALLATVLILLAVAVISAAIPARRAADTDPMESLRHE